MLLRVANTVNFLALAGSLHNVTPTPWSPNDAVILSSAMQEWASSSSSEEESEIEEEPVEAPGQPRKRRYVWK
jgi:hypothetical protein